jgi:hypothetical protein
MSRIAFLLASLLVFATANAGQEVVVADSARSIQQTQVDAHSTGCGHSTATATTIVNGKKVTKTITSQGDCPGKKGSSGSSSSSSASTSSSSSSTSDE